MVRIASFDSFGLENLKVTSRKKRAPGPGDVSVKVEAVALNYRDLMMIRGQYDPRLKMPLIPCSDGAGEVIAVGEGVENLKVGDRVCSTMIPDWQGGKPSASLLHTTLGGPVDGMLAEVVVLPQQAFMKIPDNLSYQNAACLPVAGLTAWSALVTEGEIKPGGSVLLLGTGGVSMMALDIAKKLGVDITITSGSDGKLAHAQDRGADHLINYKENPKWSKAVRAIHPEGVDVAVEVGGDGTFDQSVRSVCNGGRVAMIGVLAAENKPVNLIALLMRQIRVQGILVGSRGAFADYIAFVEKHNIVPCIDTTFIGMGQIRNAFKLLASGEHIGKIVVKL